MTWDLSGVRPGYYQAFLAIDSGTGDEACEAFFFDCSPGPMPATAASSLSERLYNLSRSSRA